jgi:hypothetical protein
MIQHAVEDEFDAWLGRAMNGARRRPQGCATGSSAPVQTAEGELSVEIPQVRERRGQRDRNRRLRLVEHFT